MGGTLHCLRMGPTMHRNEGFRQMEVKQHRPTDQIGAQPWQNAQPMFCDHKLHAGKAMTFKKLEGNASGG